MIIFLPLISEKTVGKKYLETQEGLTVLNRPNTIVVGCIDMMCSSIFQGAACQLWHLLWRRLHRRVNAECPLIKCKKQQIPFSMSHSTVCNE